RRSCEALGRHSHIVRVAGAAMTQHIYTRAELRGPPSGVCWHSSSASNYGELAAVLSGHDSRSIVPGLRAVPGAERMTLSGTVNKTAPSLVILLVAAGYVWNRGAADRSLGTWIMVSVVAGL